MYISMYVCIYTYLPHLRIWRTRCSTKGPEAGSAKRTPIFERHSEASATTLSLRPFPCGVPCGVFVFCVAPAALGKSDDVESHTARNDAA